MLRIGRYVNCYRNILARLNKNPADKEFNDIIKSLSDISNGIYFLLDHILLLNRLNFYKFDSAFISKIDFYSNLAWGVECVFNITYDVIDFINNRELLHKSRGDLRKIDNSESAGKIYYRKFINFYFYNCKKIFVFFYLLY